MVSVLRSEHGYTLGYTYGTVLQTIYETAEKWVISSPRGTMSFSKRYYSHEQIDKIYNNLIDEVSV
jgi:hypothetical protein